jgi:hypothetical protein
VFCSLKQSAADNSLLLDLVAMLSMFRRRCASVCGHVSLSSIISSNRNQAPCCCYEWFRYLALSTCLFHISLQHRFIFRSRYRLSRHCSFPCSNNWNLSLISFMFSIRATMTLLFPLFNNWNLNLISFMFT